MVKQLTVFIENKPGSLNQVTEILGNNNINIISFSLADTTDFGLLRMIVSDPEKARECLKSNMISAKLTDIIIVDISTDSGKLHDLLETLESYNIQYMYVWSNRVDKSGVVLKITEHDEAIKTLEEKGYKVLDPEKAYS